MFTLVGGHISEFFSVCRVQLAPFAEGVMFPLRPLSSIRYIRFISVVGLSQIAIGIVD